MRYNFSLTIVVKSVFLVHILLCLIGVISKSTSYAQDNPFLQFRQVYHFPDSSEIYHYNLLPLEKYGIMIVQEGVNRKWVIQRFDSQLTRVYSRQINFSTPQILRHSDQIGKTLYIQTRSKNSANHELIILDLESGNIDKLNIPRLIPIEYKTFHVIPPKIFMTGIYDRKPIVIQYDLESRRSKIMPGLYLKQQFIDQAFKDKLNRYILVVRHFNIKKKGLDVRIYTPESSQSKNFFISNSEDFNPDYVLAIDSTRLLGTFYTNNIDYPQGIFSLQLGENFPPRRTFFKDFSGYIQHLSPKQKQRYLRQKAKEVRKGKLPIIHQSVLVKSYNLDSGQVGISAENYHPYYESAQIPYTGIQGGWTSSSVMVGYQFNWILTALADMEGNLIWNQTTSRKGIMTPNLVSQSDFLINKNWWFAAWPKDGGLQYCIANKDSLMVDKRALNSNELTKFHKFSNLTIERIIPWDKNILLGVGKASLKDKPRSGSKIYWVLIKTNIAYD